MVLHTHNIIFSGYPNSEVKSMDKKSKQKPATDEKKEKYTYSENPEIDTDLARTIIENNIVAPDPKDL